MPIQVKLFAALRERAGWSERWVTPQHLPATPRSLWLQLQLSADPPAATTAAAAVVAAAALTQAAAAAAVNQALPQGIRVAVNQAFSAADTPLADGDELAFLPPISGG